MREEAENHSQEEIQKSNTQVWSWNPQGGIHSAGAGADLKAWDTAVVRISGHQERGSSSLL